MYILECARIRFMPSRVCSFQRNTALTLVLHARVWPRGKGWPVPLRNEPVRILASTSPRELDRMNVAPKPRRSRPLAAAPRRGHEDTRGGRTPLSKALGSASRDHRADQCSARRTLAATRHAVKGGGHLPGVVERSLPWKTTPRRLAGRSI